jgi:Cu/Ag efflux protein CusF
MKKVLVLSLVLGLALSGAVVAQDTSKPSQSGQQAPQAKSVRGTVTQMDNTQKFVVVKDDAGQLVTVYFNDSTRISGGDLKEGAAVSVQTTEQDGKTVATLIQIRTK